MVTIEQLDKITKIRNKILDLTFSVEEYFDMQFKKRTEDIRTTLLKFEKEFNEISNTHYINLKFVCGEYYLTLHNSRKPSEHLTNQIKFDRTTVNLHICKFVHKDIKDFVIKTLTDILK